MSGPGRRAVLPAVAWQAPAATDSSGLVVRHVDEKGQRTLEFDFGVLPIPPRLQRQLAALFGGRTGGEGGWGSVESSREMWWLVRRFCCFLASNQAGPPDGLEGITAGVWSQWAVSRPLNESGYRQVRRLAGFLRLAPELRTEVRAAMDRRRAMPARVEHGYTEAEFREIRKVCARTFYRAWRRVVDNQAELARWRSGQVLDGTPAWTRGHALDHLAGTGDVPRRVTGRGDRYCPDRLLAALGGGTAAQTWQRLFLTAPEVVALAGLLTIAHGWNATPLSELTVPDRLLGPDDATVIYWVELEKRRRRGPHRYESRNLTDWGAGSPGRLITRALQATQPARDLLAARRPG